MTNKKLNEYAELNPEATNGNKYLFNFNHLEFDGFLGLMVLIGVLRVNKDPINDLYSDDPNKSRPVFKATMPRERLKYMLRFLRFDDCATRLERIQTDKLAPIRWLFEKIQHQLIKYYKPGTYLTIDERLAR